MKSTKLALTTVGAKFGVFHEAVLPLPATIGVPSVEATLSTVTVWEVFCTCVAVVRRTVLLSPARTAALIARPGTV